MLFRLPGNFFPIPSVVPVNGGIAPMNSIKNAFSWLITPPLDGPEVHALPAPDGGRRVLFGRDPKFVYVIRGSAASPNSGCRRAVHGQFRRRPRDCTRLDAAVRVATRSLATLHLRNDRRDPLDENLTLPGNSAVAAAAGAPKVGMWAVLHESRSDHAQLLTVIFLIQWSGEDGRSMLYWQVLYQGSETSPRDKGNFERSRQSSIDPESMDRY